MRKLRWGVMSTAQIGINAVIPAMRGCSNVEVVAIASRELGKARSAARKLRIPKAYGSYEELLADPEIEAIYNPLPNHLHVPWSIRALEAGKHVLCEKPIAMNAGEATHLLEAARHFPALKVMEAFMYRFHPQWTTIADLVGQGGIGTIKTAHSIFSYYNINPADVRNIAEMGGGGLLDIGCYCISASRLIFRAEPRRVFGIVEFDPKFKTDRMVSGILDFGEGTATFTCGTQMVPAQRFEVFGNEGRLDIEKPFTPSSSRPPRLRLQRDGETQDLKTVKRNQYTVMAERFSQAAVDGTPVPTPLEDALANMRAIDAVFKSGETGRWVEL